VSCPWAPCVNLSGFIPCTDDPHAITAAARLLVRPVRVEAEMDDVPARLGFSRRKDVASVLPVGTVREPVLRRHARAPPGGAVTRVVPAGPAPTPPASGGATHQQ
jgi:hypothetical protein